MRRFIATWGLAFLFATAGFAASSSVQADPGDRVTISFFYERLGPHGHWFPHSRYGYVWRPKAVPYGWRPYTYGRWAWTVEHGWLWVSDYEWGWAPFHYGRWVYDRGYGWYWVPGTVWGPAWVAWRTGHGFIGWYPLPPGTTWSFSAGLVYGGVNVYASYYTPYWVFVPERRFLARRLHRVVVRPRHNFRFIRYTRRATRYRRVGNRIVNRSVSVRRIQRATNRRVVRTRVRVVRDWRQRRRTAPGARRVRLYQPRFAPGRAAPRPRRVTRPPFQGPRRVRPAPPRTRLAPPRRTYPQPRGKPPRQGRIRVAPQRRTQPPARGIPPRQRRTRVAPQRRTQPPARGIPPRQRRTRVAPQRRTRPQPPPDVREHPGQRRFPDGPPRGRGRGWR